MMVMTEKMDGGGRGSTGRRSSRRCVVTGRELDRSRMVRFVAGPDGSAVPDIQAVLPGRGTWVTADREQVERASAKRGALWRVGRVPDGLGDQIESLLAARCQSLIGLARRAGQLAIGFDRVRALVGACRAGVVMTAIDAAEDGRGKIERLGGAVTPEVPIIDVMTRTELGAAIGRAESVHMAMHPGQLADQLVNEAERLAKFRQHIPMSAESGNVKEATAR
jgi:hypothetical protein